jgi:hypothetical protein
VTREEALRLQHGLLWTPQALSRWASVVLISAIVLTGSWYVTAGKSVWEDQVPALNLGIAAAVAANVAGILLLVSGRRAIGVRRVALLGEPVLAAVPYPRDGAADVAAPSEDLVAGDGLLHYHRADCPMARSKSFTAATRSEHERLGRAACGVCRP